MVTGCFLEQSKNLNDPKGFGAKKLQSLIGKVVVIERESYPGVLFIKRILRIDESGLWVEGDNKEASTDSRQWGALSLDEIRGDCFISLPN